jgi:hypothetical protein
MGRLPNVLPRSTAGSPRLDRVDRVGWTVGTCFESHGLRLGVRSNWDALAERLPAVLPPGARLRRAAAVDHVFSLWVPGGTRAREIRVYSDDRPQRAHDLDDALARLEAEIRRTVAARAPRRTFVHAGAVGWLGRAILVPGRSRSGKTTLVAELVKAGAEYLSDEFAVIDRRGRVHPFAKRLSVRGPGGCDRHLRRPSAEDLGGRAGVVARPVGMVVVTEHRPGAAWSPRPLTAGEALLELLAHTGAARARPEAALDALRRAVAAALRLKGERGEAAELAPRLLAAATGAWGGGTAAPEGRS